MPTKKYLRKKAEKLCLTGEIVIKIAFWNIDRTIKCTCIVQCSSLYVKK